MNDANTLDHYVYWREKTAHSTELTEAIGFIPFCKDAI